MKKYAPLIAVMATLLAGAAFASNSNKGASEPVALTSQNFEAKTGSGVVLVDFWAEWCGPCKMIAPVVEEVARDFEGKAVVGKVDIDASPDLAQRFRVNAIPNLKILKDGKVVDEIVGFADKKDIERKLKKHLK